MNFHQLKYIVSVDRLRNFSRAAAECQIAQSTLSREIQRLEKEFNILLFDRSRHPVVPTMKGADLIEQAKSILTEHDRFTAMARKKVNRPIGNFRLGVLSNLAPYLLPLFAQQIGKRYPELNLDIFEVSPSDIIAHFEADSLDGAISISPFHKEGFYETTLFEEEFVLYMGQGHHLATLEVVKWTDIPLEELILHEEMKSFFLNQEKSLLQVEEGERIVKNISFKNGSLETIRKIIDINGGLTILPQLACLYMGDRRLEMVRPIEAPVLSRAINFVTPRGFQKKRISKVIRQAIVEGIPSAFRIAV